MKKKFGIILTSADESHELGEAPSESPILLVQVSSMGDCGEVDGVPSDELAEEELVQGERLMWWLSLAKEEQGGGVVAWTEAERSDEEET